MTTVPLSQILRHAMACRCPRCGMGPLFRGFLALRPVCTHCGLDFSKADSGDGPAVILTFLLGFLLVPPILVFALHSDWPMWLHGMIWSAVILGATLGTVRPAKALMVGLQYRHRATAFGE